MARTRRLGYACVLLLLIGFGAGAAGWEGEAATASPELVGALSKKLGATPDQAAEAAGALFGVPRSRLKAGEFSQIAKAVPGVDLLLKAAPTGGGGGGVGAAAVALSQLGGSASGWRRRPPRSRSLG